MSSVQGDRVGVTPFPRAQWPPVQESLQIQCGTVVAKDAVA